MNKEDPLRHYFQYHNTEGQGFWYEPDNGLFSIVTRKRFSRETADRILHGCVWLIAGEGAGPKQYYLNSVNRVDGIEEDEFEPGANIVYGSQGAFFGRRKLLNTEDWFDDFRRGRRNFSNGFGEIKNGRIVERLLKLVPANVREKLKLEMKTPDDD